MTDSTQPQPLTPEEEAELRQDIAPYSSWVARLLATLDASRSDLAYVNELYEDAQKVLHDRGMSASRAARTADPVTVRDVYLYEAGVAEGRAARTADPGGLRDALAFIADWANDCSDGDTFYGFADIEKRARAALASETTAPVRTDVRDLLEDIAGYAPVRDIKPDEDAFLAWGERLHDELGPEAQRILASETTAPDP